MENSVKSSKSMKTIENHRKIDENHREIAETQ